MAHSLVADLLDRRWGFLASFLILNQTLHVSKVYNFMLRINSTKRQVNTQNFAKYFNCCLTKITLSTKTKTAKILPQWNTQQIFLSIKFFFCFIDVNNVQIIITDSEVYAWKCACLYECGYLTGKRETCNFLLTFIITL